jgi:hypothetical protein
MKLYFLIFTIFISTSTFAIEENFPDLVKAATTEFLKQANNPKSILGKKIDQINVETSDGRNQDGTIPVPVTMEGITAEAIAGEEMYRPWHYADKSEDGKTCSASGDSATILILLKSYAGVHSANEYQSYFFTTDVSESFTAKRKDGGVIEYCEDIAADEANEYDVSPTTYSVSDFKESEIKTKE